MIQFLYATFQTPLDQVNLADDEMIVPVAHFHREAYTAFGTPFLIKIKEGETCEAVKERIRSHLDVPEKEFEKYRMALVQVWPLTQFFSVPFLRKIIDLPTGQINDPPLRKCFSLPFLTATPSSPSWNLEGLFELT